MVFGFFDVAVKWGNVLFFAFHAMSLKIGFFWRCVEKCDWAMLDVDLWLFYLLFLLPYLAGLRSLYFMELFGFFTNYDKSEKMAKP